MGKFRKFYIRRREAGNRYVLYRLHRLSVGFCVVLGVLACWEFYLCFYQVEVQIESWVVVVLELFLSALFGLVAKLSRNAVSTGKQYALVSLFVVLLIGSLILIAINRSAG